MSAAPDPYRLIPEDYFRPLKPEEIFPDPERPLEIDLGCGDGTFAEKMAEYFAERDFLAVERLLGRVKKVARKARQGGLENLKVLRLESGYTVRYLLPEDSVSRLHLLFPDPWPKKRHHKNRMFRVSDFRIGLEQCLRPGGEFLLKTDHREYWEDAVEELAGYSFLKSVPWDEDAFYPVTDFEAQWLAEGRSVHVARWVANA